MSSQIDFQGSDYGDHVESLLLERGPKVETGLIIVGTEGTPNSETVYETYQHSDFLGYTPPGHVHRSIVPDENGRMRFANNQGFRSGIIDASAFMPSVIGFYRVSFRVRGVAELIPWNADGSPIIFNVGRASNPQGVTFTIAGPFAGLRNINQTFNHPADSIRTPTNSNTPTSNLILNQTAQETPIAPLGARFIDRIVSASVTGNAGGIFNIFNLSYSSIWDKLIDGEMRRGGTFGEGTFPLPATNAELGVSLAGSSIFWAADEEFNPPSLVFPHAPMMLESVPILNQLRLEVVFAGARFESTSRPQEYFDL